MYDRGVLLEILGNGHFSFGLIIFNLTGVKVKEASEGPGDEPTKYRPMFLKGEGGEGLGDVVVILTALVHVEVELVAQQFPMVDSFRSATVFLGPTIPRNRTLRSKVGVLAGRVLLLSDFGLLNALIEEIHEGSRDVELVKLGLGVDVNPHLQYVMHRDQVGMDDIETFDVLHGP
jgi:hypothetical protein